MSTIPYMTFGTADGKRAGANHSIPESEIQAIKDKLNTVTEVPATNDPMPYTFQGRRYAEPDGYGDRAYRPRPEFDAEAPADEGLLREDLRAVLGREWNIGKSLGPRMDDVIAAMMPRIATELQKARNETVRKVEDWFWRNSESTVENHIQFNSEVDIL